jgi:hypothetical protein
MNLFFRNKTACEVLEICTIDITTTTNFQRKGMNLPLGSQRFYRNKLNVFEHEFPPPRRGF